MKRDTLVALLLACGARPCLRGETARIQFLFFRPSNPGHGEWGLTLITRKVQSYYCEKACSGLIPQLIEAGVPREVIDKNL